MRWELNTDHRSVTITLVTYWFQCELDQSLYGVGVINRVRSASHILVSRITWNSKRFIDRSGKILRLLRIVSRIFANLV